MFVCNEARQNLGIVSSSGRGFRVQFGKKKKPFVNPVVFKPGGRGSVLAQYGRYCGQECLALLAVQNKEHDQDDSGSHVHW